MSYYGKQVRHTPRVRGLIVATTMSSQVWPLIVAMPWRCPAGTRTALLLQFKRWRDLLVSAFVAKHCWSCADVRPGDLLPSGYTSDGSRVCVQGNITKSSLESRLTRGNAGSKCYRRAKTLKLDNWKWVICLLFYDFFLVLRRKDHAIDEHKAVRLYDSWPSTNEWVE